MSDDGGRKGEGEWVREEGDVTPIQVCSGVQVSCSGDQDYHAFLSSEAPDQSAGEIRARNVTKWLKSSDSWLKYKVWHEVKGQG